MTAIRASPDRHLVVSCCGSLALGLVAICRGDRALAVREVVSFCVGDSALAPLFKRWGSYSFLDYGVRDTF